MVAILIALLALLVLAAILSPWRFPQSLGLLARTDGRIDALVAELADLEAARDAKYREIRDAELDRETGKLTPADFTAVDAGLRAEAVAILRDLDRAEDRLRRLQRRRTEAAGPATRDAAEDREPALPSSAP